MAVLLVSLKFRLLYARQPDCTINQPRIIQRMEGARYGARRQIESFLFRPRPRHCRRNALGAESRGTDSERHTKQNARRKRVHQAPGPGIARHRDRYFRAANRRCRTSRKLSVRGSKRLRRKSKNLLRTVDGFVEVRCWSAHWSPFNGSRS